MNSRAIQIAAMILAAAFLNGACNKALVIKDVDYTQQVESVLIPSQDGMVSDIRYGISYSILPIQLEEFNDTSKVLIEEVKMIRNSEGFYFITAEGFKNVYVASPGNGEFRIVKTIQVHDEGIIEPALNMRNPAIQLLSGNKQIAFINQHGIINQEG